MSSYFIKTTRIERKSSNLDYWVELGSQAPEPDDIPLRHGYSLLLVISFPKSLSLSLSLSISLSLSLSFCSIYSVHSKTLDRATSFWDAICFSIFGQRILIKNMLRASYFCLHKKMVLSFSFWESEKTEMITLTLWIIFAMLCKKGCYV